MKETDSRFCRQKWGIFHFEKRRYPIIEQIFDRDTTQYFNVIFLQSPEYRLYRLYITSATRLHLYISEVSSITNWSNLFNELNTTPWKIRFWCSQRKTWHPQIECIEQIFASEALLDSYDKRVIAIRVLSYTPLNMALMFFLLRACRRSGSWTP